MAQAIKFKNFTDRDFQWSFDSIPYTFKAGETIYLEDFKAKHFAKHLVDRELNVLGIPTNNQFKRDELEIRCYPDTEVISAGQALDKNMKAKEVIQETVESPSDTELPEPKAKVEEEFPELKKTKTKK